MRFEEAFCPRHVEYYGKDLSTISQAFRADIKIDCSGTFFRATPFLDGPGSVLSRRIWQKQLGLHLGWEPINTNSTATFDQGQQFLETLFMFGAQEICEDRYFSCMWAKIRQWPTAFKSISRFGVFACWRLDSCQPNYFTPTERRQRDTLAPRR